MRDNGKFYKRDSEAECPNLRAGRSGLASQLLPGFGITGLKRVERQYRPLTKEAPDQRGPGRASKGGWPALDQATRRPMASKPGELEAHA